MRTAVSGQKSGPASRILIGAPTRRLRRPRSPRGAAGALRLASLAACLDVSSRPSGDVVALFVQHAHDVRGLSVRQLARRYDVSRQIVERWLTGERVPVRRRVVERIQDHAAQVLGRARFRFRLRPLPSLFAEGPATTRLERFARMVLGAVRELENETPRARLLPGDVLYAAEKAIGLEPGALSSSSRAGALVDARRAVAAVLRVRYGLTTSAIGAALGRSHQRVSYWLETARLPGGGAP